MKKCNLKSPFYYHRRGFVIENKTDFNRSPCFMIIFIHVEGLFRLGRIHIILYTSHIVCAAWAMLFHPLNNKFVWVSQRDFSHDKSMPTATTATHWVFHFLTCNPAGPAVGIHVGRLSKWKVSFPWGEFPSKQTQNRHTRMRASLNAYIYSSDNERIYLRTIIRPLVTNSPHRPW